MNRTKKIPFTTSYLFILPMFGLPMSVYKEAGIINSYCDYYKFNRPYLLHTVFYNKPEYEENLLDLITMFDDAVLNVEYIGDKVIVTLQVQKDFLSDYDLILESKYSQLSDLYRSYVSDKPSNPNSKSEKRLQLQIMDKDEKCRRNVECIYEIELEEGYEIWRRFDKEEETITKDVLKTLLYKKQPYGTK
jgi:hypothetical protein